MWRDVDRRNSLEPVGQIFGIVSIYIPESYIVLLFLSGPPVVDAKTTLTVGVHNVRVAWFGDCRTCLTPPMCLP